MIPWLEHDTPFPEVSTALTQDAPGLLAAGADPEVGEQLRNGTLTVDKAHLTVTANDATREYGDANPAFSGSITGFKLAQKLPFGQAA